MAYNDFLWLQRWYQLHCHVNRKQGECIDLNTLDNPGWIIYVNLENTTLQGKEFHEINVELSEDNWVQCQIRNGKFDGACGPENLPEVLHIFRQWAEKFDSTQSSETEMIENDDFLWLQKWYFSHCDGDWEHDRRIHLNSIHDHGWSLTINVDWTELEDKQFQEVEIQRSEHNWLFCTVRRKVFEATCGLESLPEVLHIFRNWAEEEMDDDE